MDLEQFMESEFLKHSSNLTFSSFRGNPDLWANFSQNYSRNLKLNVGSEPAKTPKVIHQIWIGSDLPRHLRYFTKSITDNNPDFEYILWDDKKIRSLDLKNPRAYEMSENFAVKSDIARLEILNLFGGFYFDTDFELFERIPLRFMLNDFVVGLAYGNKSFPVFGNAFIFSPPRHKIIQRLLRDVHNIPHNGNDPETVMNFLGPYKLSIAVNQHIRSGGNDWLVLPSDIFYPWPSYAQNNHANKYTYLRDVSVGMHHWHTSWIPSWQKIASKILGKLR